MSTNSCTCICFHHWHFRPYLVTCKNAVWNKIHYKKDAMLCHMLFFVIHAYKWVTMSGHLFGLYRSLAGHVSAGRRIFVFCQVLYFFVNKGGHFYTLVSVYTPCRYARCAKTKWHFFQDSAVHSQRPPPILSSTCSNLQSRCSSSLIHYFLSGPNYPTRA